MMKYSDGLDEVAAALANGGRRQIVDRLSAGGATTTDLATMLHVGLPAPLTEYSTWLAARRSFWHGQLAALDRAVDARG